MRRMVKTVWRRTRWYIPSHADIRKTSISVFFLVSRFVAEWLFDGMSSRRHENRRTTTMITAILLQSIESSDNGWSCFRWCRPPRARYCLQDAGHQTPPIAAPNCRFLSLLMLLQLLLLRQTRWPCNERQQQRIRLPLTAVWTGRRRGY